jgi:hypothetical protein
LTGENRCRSREGPQFLEEGFIKGLAAYVWPFNAVEGRNIIGVDDYGQREWSG